LSFALPIVTVLDKLTGLFIPEIPAFISNADAKM